MLQSWFKVHALTWMHLVECSAFKVKARLSTLVFYCNAGFAQTYLRSVCRWIQSWATLVTAASSYAAVKPRLILDFIDYPDKAGLQWQSQDNGLSGSGTACHLAGDTQQLNLPL